MKGQRNFKMKNNLSKLLSLLLVLTFVFTLTGVSAAQEKGDSRENQELSTEWEPSPSMTEEELEAYGEQLYREAEATVTPEQIAEAQKFLDEEEKFFSNLTPETLWQTYLDENPEVFTLSKSEILEIKQEVEALYEEIVSVNSRATYTNAKRAYCRYFSSQDGLGTIARLNIEAYGAQCLDYAASEFPNDVWKQDAFRHYSWNYYCMLSSLIGITLNTRENSTRIYTTNYELANNLLRRNVIVRTDSPTSTQLATALTLRNNILNISTCSTWDAYFSGSTPNEYGIGRDELMDLWNNEHGRQDGRINSWISMVIPFNDRWNNNTVIKNNTTFGVTVGRRQTIWNNNWYKPVR